MNPMLKSRLSKPTRCVGSFGSVNGEMSIPTPPLTFLGYSKGNINRVTPLFKNGRWNKVAFNLKEGDVFNIHYEFSGDGMTNLFATFYERAPLTNQDTGQPLRKPDGGRMVGQVRQYLFVRPVGTVVGQRPNHTGMVKVIIPTTVKGLVFHTSKQLPSDVSRDYLTEKGASYLHANSLDMIPSLSLTSFRSPSFDGLRGPPIEFRSPSDDSWSTTKSPDLKDDLWRGDKRGHLWKKHGWTGGTSKGPHISATNDPYIAMEAGYYVWREGHYSNFQNPDLLGWDAWERAVAAVPAGLPVCFTGRIYEHDRDTGLKRPAWHHASDETMPKENFFICSAINHYFRGASSKSPYKVWVGWGHDSVLEKTVPSSGDLRMDLYEQSTGGGMPALFKGDSKTPLDTDANIRGRNYSIEDPRSLAWKIEWWDWKNNKWTKPDVHPPHDVTLTGRGDFKLIFRFPRQLGENDPDIALSPQYDISKTWDCYPRFTGHSSEGVSPKPFEIGFDLIGRPEKEGDSPLSKTVTKMEYEGYNVRGVLQTGGYFCVKWGSQILYNADYYMKATDPTKFAYINNPNIGNVYWASGEFAPGSILIVIGQSLGTVMSYAMSKNEGDTPQMVREGVYGLDRAGLSGGEKDHDLFNIKYHITTSDLTDTGVARYETEVMAKWKEVFDKNLTAEWFRTVGKGGTMADGTIVTGLKNMDPNNPLHYTVNHEGNVYSFPYSIAFIEIPHDWAGPVLDFVDNEGTSSLSEKSIKKGEPCYISGITALWQNVNQQVNLDEEIDQQLELLLKGLSPDEAMVGNDMDHNMVTVTEAAVNDQRIRETEQGKKEAKAKLGLNFWPFNRRTLVVDNPIRKYTLIPIGKTQRLEGIAMNNNAAYTLSDVTDRYSADHVTALGQKSRTARFDIDEVYLVNGRPTGASVDWFAGAAPEPQPMVVKPPQQRNLGNLNGRALHARATKRGNPLMGASELEVTLINPNTVGQSPFRLGTSVE